MTAARGSAWILLLFVGAALLFGGIVQLMADRPVASGLAFAQGNLGMSWSELAWQHPVTATAWKMRGRRIDAYPCLVTGAAVPESWDDRPYRPTRVSGNVCPHERSRREVPCLLAASQ